MAWRSATPNWLFARSKTGGERAAAIYSFVNTAKANGVEPQARPTDILARLGEGCPATRLDALIQWNWRAERALVDLTA